MLRIKRRTRRRANDYAQPKPHEILRLISAWCASRSATQKCFWIQALEAHFAGKRLRINAESSRLGCISTTELILRTNAQQVKPSRHSQLDGRPRDRNLTGALGCEEEGRCCNSNLVNSLIHRAAERESAACGVGLRTRYKSLMLI